MKNLLTILFYFFSISSFAQLKIDGGFTTMGSLKRKVKVGTIYQSNTYIDTAFKTRVYQPGALCLYIKPIVYVHEVGEYSRGMLSFPINIGLSSYSKQSSTYGPTKKTIIFEYDAAVLYGIASGACIPNYNGYSKTGFFAAIGVGFVGLTKNPKFENEDLSKPSSYSDINFLSSTNDNKVFFNKMNIGPVLHVGVQSNFFSFYDDEAEQGVAITLRPGFGKSFSYLQFSIFMTTNWGHKDY